MSPSARISPHQPSILCTFLVFFSLSSTFNPTQFHPRPPPPSQAIYQVVLASKSPYGSHVSDHGTIIAQQLGLYKLNVQWYTVVRLLLPDVAVWLVCLFLRRRARQRVRRALQRTTGLRRRNAVDGTSRRRHSAPRPHSRHAPDGYAVEGDVTETGSAVRRRRKQSNGARRSPATAEMDPRALVDGLIVEERAAADADTVSPPATPSLGELDWDDSTMPAAVTDGMRRRAAPSGTLPVNTISLAPSPAGPSGAPRPSAVPSTAPPEDTAAPPGVFVNRSARSSVGARRAGVPAPPAAKLQVRLVPTAGEHASQRSLWAVLFTMVVLNALAAVLFPSAAGLFYLAEAIAVVVMTHKHWSALESRRIVTSVFVHRVVMLLNIHLVVACVHLLLIHLFQVRWSCQRGEYGRGTRLQERGEERNRKMRGEEGRRERREKRET